MKIFKSEKGFTLLELLVCLFIISLLTGIAIPAYHNINERAKVVAFDAQVRELHQAAQMHLAEGGDVIWAPGAGAVANGSILGDHEGWFRWFSVWPDNPMGTGDYVVEIVDGQIYVSPGRGE